MFSSCSRSRGSEMGSGEVSVPASRSTSTSVAGTETYPDPDSRIPRIRSSWGCRTWPRAPPSSGASDDEDFDSLDSTRSRSSAVVRSRLVLLRVVGDVPARSLELNRGRRHQLHDGTGCHTTGRRSRVHPRNAGCARTGGRRLRSGIRIRACHLEALELRAYSITSPPGCWSISCRCAQNGAAPWPSRLSWNVRNEKSAPCCAL